MRQLFQNLIGNALKFRKKDVPPVVMVRAEPIARVNAFEDDAEAPPPLWLIRISDNGIGFEPKYKEKIFEVFQRLHNRAEYEGSGIGLSLCRKIVQRHGGSITAESEFGQGTTFLVTLPEKHQSAAGPKAAPDSTEETQRRGEDKKTEPQMDADQRRS
jgi:signal transduction histidine kinase